MFIWFFVHILLVYLSRFVRSFVVIDLFYCLRAVFMASRWIFSLLLLLFPFRFWSLVKDVDLLVGSVSFFTPDIQPLPVNCSYYMVYHLPGKIGRCSSLGFSLNDTVCWMPDGNNHFSGVAVHTHAAFWYFILTFSSNNHLYWCVCGNQYPLFNTVYALFFQLLFCVLHSSCVKWCLMNFVFMIFTRECLLQMLCIRFAITILNEMKMLPISLQSINFIEQGYDFKLKFFSLFDFI